MSTLTHKCPHCLTDFIGLQIVQVSHASASSSFVHLSCPKCHFPSAASLTRIRAGGLEPGQWIGHQVDITEIWRVDEFWPAVPGPLIPEFLDDDVARIYLQAERNFPVAGNEEAAGTMYRKALDVGLKKVAPDAKGTLAARIKTLAASHKLTPAIAEWADHVRDLGNEAAHEDVPPTGAELATLRSFTEMVMRYLFTLPKMVELRKVQPEPPRT